MDRPAQHDGMSLEGTRPLKASLTVPAVLAGCLVLIVLSVAWYSGLLPTGLTSRVASISGDLLGRTLSAGHLTYMGGVALAFAIEVAFVGYRDSSLARVLRPSRSTIVDLFCVVSVVTGIGWYLTTFVSFGLAGPVAHRLSGLVPSGLLAVHNPVLQTFWIFVAGDFFKYWLHFFEHKVPFWWQAHKFHHAATEMNIVTAAREHPVQSALDFMAMAIPNALLAGDATQFLALQVLTSIGGGFNHSMLEWRYGWIGRWILISPITHRIHHSPIPEHHDRNFGATFVIWDRLFGTYYGGTALNTTVDVVGNPYNRHPLPYDLYLCAKLSLTKLVTLPFEALRVVR